MKKLTIIILLIPTIIFGQGWERTYGGGNLDVGYSIQQTTDGGYIITGYTASYRIGYGVVYLIKIDCNGDTIWTNTYGNTNYGATGYSVSQTIDGGYIITGFTRNEDLIRDVFLIKTDSYGDTLWTKAYGRDYEDFGYSVQQTNDGGYIIAGKSNTLESHYTDVYLIKTKSNGDTTWTKTYGGPFDDSGYEVQQTNDGGYVITGCLRNSDFNHDVYVIKTDSYGDTLWTKTYGGDNNDFGKSIKQTSDGGYIITGSTFPEESDEEDVYLIKTDSFGDTLWTKTYGGDYSDAGTSIDLTDDNGYIITGAISDYTPNSGIKGDVCIIKTNSDGDTLWTRIYGKKYSSCGYSVQQTTDGGYIIAGVCIQEESYDDFYVIKTDENGIITWNSDIPIPDPNRKLVKMFDMSGRLILEPNPNQLYIEVYDDGSTVKKVMIEK